MSESLQMKCLLATVLLALTAAASRGEEKKVTKPNILIIVGDDMGYADVGVQGCKDIPTPHIDSIAKNGIRFTNGYVSGPYCSPTRAGMMTGRYQTRFGHEFNPGNPAPANFGLSLKETTIAQRLHDLGYATGIVGKWHLGNQSRFMPTERGFQEFFGFLGGAHPYLPGRGAPIYRGTQQVTVSEYLTDEFNREAVAFIDKHQKVPFFLYLAFNAVHTPLAATDKYLQRFKEIKDPKRQKYAAMMSAMDDAVGAVLSKLHDTGIEQNTLVFFISDNGGPVGVNGSDNTPLRGKKAQTWEGGIRVPWMMQWKGRLPAGKVLDMPVIQIDMLPTALAAAGQEANPEWKLDGVNLLPYLEGQKSGEAHAGGLFWRFGNQMAARVGDYVLVDAPGSKGKELYNLRDDIGQTKNLSAEQPERVKQLQTAWDEWNKNNIPAAWRPNGNAKGKGKGDG